MNKHRGERELTVGGQTYTLRPTHQALQEIEDRLDCGVVELAIKIGENKYRMRDICIATHEAMKAGGSTHDEDVSNELVMEAGLINVTAIIGSMLTDSLMGGRQKKAANQVSQAKALTG